MTVASDQDSPFLGCDRMIRMFKVYMHEQLSICRLKGK